MKKLIIALCLLPALAIAQGGPPLTSACNELRVNAFVAGRDGHVRAAANAKAKYIHECPQQYAEDVADDKKAKEAQRIYRVRNK
jgi:hypothetical protein